MTSLYFTCMSFSITIITTTTIVILLLLLLFIHSDLIPMDLFSDAATSEVRQAYKQFLGALVELINDEVVSEEFSEVAKTVYDLFNDLDMESDATKRLIEKR
jgi:hypothetical protein